ncbi:peptidylprolyl isomerase [Salinarimonas ramus]|uniref:Peptidyl-prolyl cis-trans isomerase n=1 Tax=Salinarimonas ramus TaxID=690164 RepID=A0A917QF43_9HYPH|nr:peptidylprolyl isomerase [Salinarimonas ramus]GGK48415.1 peptidyl-prolyl cis-trans isomerase [Salinarimonas ramus]
MKTLLAAFALMLAAVLPAAAQENTLVMETPHGEVVIELREDLAPQHAERLRTLTSQGFYDGVPFHRVISGFMAQTGDPTGTGTGGSDLPDLSAEFTNTPFRRGSIGMARTQDPNSANSQFFIVYDRAEWLDNQYTYVGDVVSGMEAIDALAKGVGQSGMVPNPDRIVSMRVGQ